MPFELNLEGWPGEGMRKDATGTQISSLKTRRASLEWVRKCKGFRMPGV